MQWGEEQSAGQYIDLSSAVAALTLFPIGYLLHAEEQGQLTRRHARRLALARNVGAQAEQVFYRGRQHGFDFSEKDPMSADTVVRVARVVRFFRSMLLESFQGWACVAATSAWFETRGLRISGFGTEPVSRCPP